MKMNKLTSGTKSQLNKEEKNLGRIIMGGDLNTFLDNKLDKLDKSPSTNKKYKRG